MKAKKIKEYLENPPLIKIGGATHIDFGKIIKEEMKDPEFKKGVELEMKKLELSLDIIKLRKKKRISQGRLAEKIGMKQSAIGRIEKGEQNLTIETLQKIASAFNKELVVSFK